MVSETERRKEEHLRIPLERDVQSIASPWDIRLRHNALPEMDLADVRTDTQFLGCNLQAPVLITGMTGGASKAREFNDELAKAAATHGVAMGVGSQRAAIEDPSLANTYNVILEHDVPMRIANVGLPQVLLWGEEAAGHAETALEMIDGHAIAIHLNYLQEVVQPEGDTNGAGGMRAIIDLVNACKKPVIVKETGAGMTGETIQALYGAGVAAVDVGGLGGTSFSAVEAHRADDLGDEMKSRLGRTYWDWGIPTPDSIRAGRALAPELPLIATGGLRHGLDALRSLCLGANIAGFAGTMFRAAADKKASMELAKILEELKTGLFLLGLRHTRDATEDHIA